MLMAVFAILTVLDPPITSRMAADFLRGEKVEKQWVSADELPLHLPLALIAAEDANFCLHWGFDKGAILASTTGGSSISQKTVRDLFLWREGGWFERLLETALVPVAEVIWSKRRISEIFMNITEFAPGIYGVEMASQKFFDRSASEISETESAQLAASLSVDALALPAADDSRVRSILSGIQLVRKDQRSACVDG